MNILIQKIFPKFLRNFYRGSYLYQKRLIKKWNESNNSHLIKRKTILSYKEKYNIKTLIETGTYLGEMVYAQKDFFDKIISIEISKELFQSAKKRFKRFKNIEFINGDSGEILKKIVQYFNTPCLFWLDGHYSGGNTGKGEKDTPIIDELEAILSTEIKHTVLIDDARCFKNETCQDYPSIEKLKKLIKKIRPDYHLEIKDGIIRLTI